MNKTTQLRFKKPAFIFFISLALIASFILIPDAKAFWIWTPKTNKFINPKKAAKDTPKEQFKWAMQFFDDTDYKRAAEEFINLTRHFKDSDLAPEAQYYAGLSYENAGKYYTAFQAYQRTIDVYPFTKRIDEIIEKEYNIGRILYKKHSGKLMGKEIMTDLDRAAEIFQTIRENVPFGEYADKAQFMIGECYKKSEQYDEAAKAYQKIINDYPESGLLDKAKYEVAQAAYMASFKAEYDQELTDQAIKEFKKVAEKTKGLDVSDEAKEAIASLEDKKAEGLFKTAKFYENLKHYKSAVIYYREILERYPRTSYGGLARENIEYINEFLAE